MTAWLVVVGGGVLLLGCTRAVLRAITREARIIMTALADITAEVANVKSVELSAITLLSSLKERLDAAIAASEEDDGAALEALSADLASSSTALAAAVAANTPADPSGGTGAKSFDGSVATAQTGSPSPADLPDGHPFKPTDETPQNPPQS